MTSERLTTLLPLALTLFVTCALASASAPHPAEIPATQGASHADHYPAYDHPTLPKSHSTWPGLMTLIVVGMFLAAAAVGIVVVLNLPGDAPPPADEHDDHAHGHHADAHQGHH